MTDTIGTDAPTGAVVAEAPKPRAKRAPKPAAPAAGTRSYTVLTRRTAATTVVVHAESESAARMLAEKAGGFAAKSGRTVVERETVYAWRTPAPKAGGRGR